MKMNPVEYVVKTTLLRWTRFMSYGWESDFCLYSWFTIYIWLYNRQQIIKLEFRINQPIKMNFLVWLVYLLLVNVDGWINVHNVHHFVKVIIIFIFVNGTIVLACLEQGNWPW